MFCCSFCVVRNGPSVLWRQIPWRSVCAANTKFRVQPSEPRLKQYQTWQHALLAFSSSVGEVTKFSSALHIHSHTMHTCTGRHCENTYSCMCMHTHIHTHLKKSFISWLICLSRCLRQTISFFLPGASVPADSISENRLHPGPLFGSWLMACSFSSTSTFLPHPHFGRLS